MSTSASPSPVVALVLAVLCSAGFHLCAEPPPVQFGPTATFSLPSVAQWPGGMVAVDLTGDNKLDLAFNCHSIVVLAGGGDGSFTLKTNVHPPIGNNLASAIVAADFNGDGLTDLVAGNTTDEMGYFGTLTVLLKKDAATFGQPTSLTFNNSLTPVRYLAAGDLNGDGKTDLVATVGNESYGGALALVKILLGNGAGSFTFFTNYILNGWAEQPALADLNHDGKLDLVFANYDSNCVAVFMGNGDGSFTFHTNCPVGFGPRSLVLADLNGDGEQDLVVANYAGASVTVLLGDSSGDFRPVPGTDRFGYTTDLSTAIAAADFNGDGFLDVITANNGGTLGIMLGRGNGELARPTKFYVSTATCQLAVGDFDGDGRPDLAATGLDASVSVLLNRTPPALRATALETGGLKLTWPNWPGYHLESTTNLPAANTWTPSSLTVRDTAGQRTATNSLGQCSEFFRLKKDQ